MHHWYQLFFVLIFGLLVSACSSTGEAPSEAQKMRQERYDKMLSGTDRDVIFPGPSR